MAEQQEIGSLASLESLLAQYADIRGVLADGVGQLVQNAKGAAETTEEFAASVLTNPELDLNGENIPGWKKLLQQQQELDAQEMALQAQEFTQDVIESAQAHVIQPLTVEGQNIASMFQGEQLTGLFGEAVKGFASMGVQTSDPSQSKGPGVARGEGMVYGGDSLLSF